LTLQEVNSLFTEIGLRLNQLDAIGQNPEMKGRRVVNLKAGVKPGDAVRVDQAFLLSELASVIIGTTNRIEITDNGDETITISTADALEIPDFSNADHTHQDAAGGAQLDHGLAMTAASLLDDDHPNLHNDARGDARYYTRAQVVSLLTENIDSILCRNGEILIYKEKVLTYG